MTSPNSETLPGGRLHLFGLPQELQDIIFEYAFQRDPGTSIVRSSEHRPFQGPLPYVQTYHGSGLGTEKFVRRRKVDDFMVSKQFLVAAARVYVGSQPVILEDAINSWNSKLLIAFARRATSDLFMWILEEAPCLRSLRATTDPILLHIWEAKDEAELPLLTQRLKAEDFEHLRVVAKMDSIRGLNDFELGTGSRMRGCRSAEEFEIWSANLKTLEAALRAKVTRPRIDDTEEWPRLYAGSRVHWQSFDEFCESRAAREKAQEEAEEERERELRARKPRLTYEESFTRFLEDRDRRFRAKYGETYEEQLVAMGIRPKKKPVPEPGRNSTTHPEASQMEAMKEESLDCEDDTSSTTTDAPSIEELKVSPDRTTAVPEEDLVCENQKAADSEAQRARDTSESLKPTIHKPDMVQQEMAASERTEMATRMQELGTSLAAARAEIARLKGSPLPHGTHEPSGWQRARKFLMIVFLLWVAWWLIEFYAEMKAELHLWLRANGGIEIPASRYCKLMVR